jgi:putative uncharacterized protein gbs0401
MKIKKSSKNKKKTPEIVQEKGSLNLIADNQKPRYKYDKNWENRTFLDIVKTSSVKAILTNVANTPLALSNGFGYMQIVGVQGKDVYTCSPSEQIETIGGYKQYLDAIDFDFTELTTRLPTDTRQQIIENKRKHEIVTQELLSSDLDERIRVQKEHQRDVLEHNIKIDEIIGREHYNTEFFHIYHGRTLEELNYKTQAINNASTGFRPRQISAEKKEQIIMNFNNPNGNGE